MSLSAEAEAMRAAKVANFICFVCVLFINYNFPVELGLNMLIFIISITSVVKLITTVTAEIKLK